MSIKLSSYNQVICSSAKGKTFLAAKLALGSSELAFASPIFDGEGAVYHADEFAIAPAR